MSTANKNTEYEQFVRSITEAVLHAQGLETVVVQHDVQVQGISRSHQIDVYWEYRLGGVLHRVIINCKRYAHTVEVTDVLTLSGVLADMPGVRGLVVTTVGFQKGAIDYARTHNIGLKIVRPPREDDWDGRIRTIKLQLNISEPELLSCNVQLNAEWLKANVSDPGAVTDSGEHNAHLTTVRDLADGSVYDMNALWNRSMRENPTRADTEGGGVLRWNDARFERAGKQSVRVDAIEFRWRIHPAVNAMNFELRSAPDAIVRDAIAGTLLFVDLDGKITGDVEQELGHK